MRNDQKSHLEIKPIFEKKTRKICIWWNENLYCYCQSPYDANGEVMVGCEGTGCNCLWYHKTCAFILECVIINNWTWVSKDCIPPVHSWGGNFENILRKNTCTSKHSPFNNFYYKFVICFIGLFLVGWRIFATVKKKRYNPYMVERSVVNLWWNV